MVCHTSNCLAALTKHAGEAHGGQQREPKLTNGVAKCVSFASSKKDEVSNTTTCFTRRSVDSAEEDTLELMFSGAADKILGDVEF